MSNLLRLFKRGSGKDGISASIDVSEQVRCSLCGRLLALKIEVVVKPTNASFFRKLSVEEHEEIVYLHVYKPFPYPADTYYIRLCRGCYELFRKYIDEFIDEISKSGKLYEADSVEGWLYTIEFRSLKGLRKFLDDQAVWFTKPRLEWIYVPHKPGACGSSVYALVTYVAIRNRKTNNMEIVRAYVDVADIVSELRKRLYSHGS